MGSTFAWLADEWYLIARQPLPPESHYEDYPQIGNGVGSIRLFLKEFEAIAQTLPEQVSPARTLTWVVGNAVEHAFTPLVERLNCIQGLTIHMAAISSDYWGQEITVTGLLTGQDIIDQLQEKPLGDAVLIPSLMLKQSDNQQADTTYFLDDVSLSTVESKLNCSVLPVSGLERLTSICVAPAFPPAPPVSSGV